MIVCEHCESALHLRITSSRIRFDSVTDDIAELDEEYRCRQCDLTGKYRYVGGVETIDGAIVRTGEIPRTLCGHKRGEVA